MSKEQGPPIATAEELSRLMGRDPSQISRWTKSERWPFNRQPPWARGDITAMLKWAAETLRGTKAGAPGSLSDEKKKREIRKLDVQIAILETEHAKTRGDLVGVDALRENLLRLMGVFVGQLQGFAASNAPLCEGKNAAEIQDVLETGISTTLENIRAGMAEIAGELGEPPETPRQDDAKPMGGEEPDTPLGGDGGTGSVEE